MTRTAIDTITLIFGTPAAPIPLQMFRTRTADLVAVLLHASHFAFFIMFAVVLWQTRRRHFGVFARGLGLVMLIGIICYAIIPTAPLSTDEVRERAGRNHLEVLYADDVAVGCSTVRPPSDSSTATVIAPCLKK